LSSLVVTEIDGFSHGDQHKDLPEIMSIVEARKTTRLGASAEAVKGVQSDIFLIGNASRGVAQSGTRQAHEPAEIGAPEPLRSDLVTLLER
jgi:hypothetical protein